MMGYSIRAPKLTVLLSLMGGKKSSSRLAAPMQESLKDALLEEFREEDSETMMVQVPKGFLAVYVGPEMRRFVIPASYLCLPAFRPLMEKVVEEFGFEQTGGLRIPCEEEDFEEMLRALEDSAAAKEKKKTRKHSKQKLD